MATEVIQTDGQPNTIRVGSSHHLPLIPSDEGHRRGQGLRMRAALDAVAAIQDGPDVDDGEFFRALDQSHPDRPSHEAWY